MDTEWTVKSKPRRGEKTRSRGRGRGRGAAAAAAPVDTGRVRQLDLTPITITYGGGRDSPVLDDGPVNPYVQFTPMNSSTGSMMPNTSTIELVPLAINRPERTQLLILDMNKVVCNKEYDPVLRKSVIIDYVEAKEFVRDMLQLYEVAFYSSSAEHNVVPTLKRILGELYEQLKFVWHGNMVVQDPVDITLSYKPLMRVFTARELVGFKRGTPPASPCITFNNTNTLLVDDSPRKVQTVNRPENYLIIDAVTTGVPPYAAWVPLIAAKFAHMATLPVVAYDITQLKY